MFTATTTNKDFRQGIFQVTVDFTDGTETITEAFNITSEEDLNRRIEARLATLNELDSLKDTLVLGAWVKPTDPKPPTEPNPIDKAESKLYELKRLIELGVMKETDQEFIDAVAAYKLAVSIK